MRAKFQRTRGGDPGGDIWSRSRSICGIESGSGGIGSIVRSSWSHNRSICGIESGGHARRIETNRIAGCIAATSGTSTTTKGLTRALNKSRVRAS